MYKSNTVVHIIPFFFLLLLILFESSYNSLLYFHQYTPLYEFIVIFFWCSFVPRSMPIVLLILVGLFRDFLLMTPMWISAGSFVLLKLMIAKQEVLVKDRSYFIIMMLFLIDLVIISILQILLILMTSSADFFVLVKIFFSRIPMTLILYIPACGLFYMILKTLSSKEDA